MISNNFQQDAFHFRRLNMTQTISTAAFLCRRLVLAILITGFITACSPPSDNATANNDNNSHTNASSGISPDAPAEDSLAADTVAEALQQSGTHAMPRTQEFDWMSMARWEQMHEEDVAIADAGGVDLLFLGDSITEGWEQSLWEKYFAPYGAANFGIGGDHTGNLLWRLQNGAKGALQPKVVVLLIGVNNFGHLNETPEQVFAGVTAVVNEVQTAFPTAKILLNGVFPYGQAADTAQRRQVKELNKLIATLAQSDRILFQDYGPLLLDEAGSISSQTMGDFLHLTPEGYAIWAEAMLPTLHAWLERSAIPED
jgi:lysophospholipase L1-like esterase